MIFDFWPVVTFLTNCLTCADQFFWAIAIRAVEHLLKFTFFRTSLSKLSRFLKTSAEKLSIDSWLSKASFSRRVNFFRETTVTRSNNDLRWKINGLSPSSEVMTSSSTWVWKSESWKVSWKTVVIIAPILIDIWKFHLKIVGTRKPYENNVITLGRMGTDKNKQPIT